VEGTVCMHVTKDSFQLMELLDFCTTYNLNVLMFLMNIEHAT